MKSVCIFFSVTEPDLVRPSHAGFPLPKKGACFSALGGLFAFQQ